MQIKKKRSFRLVGLAVAFALGAPAASYAQEIVIDNANVGIRDTTRSYAGSWCVANAPGNYGSNSLYSCGGSNDRYRWTFSVPTSGAYEVYVWWPQSSDRSKSAPYTVYSNAGLSTKTFDQTSGSGSWVLHGTFNFAARKSWYVSLSSANGRAGADAIRVVPAGAAPPPPPTSPPPSGSSSLSLDASNASSAFVRIYPNDTSGGSDGTAPINRTYKTGSRVWVSAPLRSGSNYFLKWQKNGADFDRASTTSLSLDANTSLTAVYETPSCNGIAVFPGTDSIRSAMASAPAGSTFCIKSGVHRFTREVVARANDKFIGETGAILSGAKIVNNFAREGSYWAATGQTQQEPAYPATNGGYPVCNASTPACIYPEKVFVNSVELMQVTSLSALSSGEFFFDYANNKIYLADDPSGRTVEATVGAGGLIGYTNAGQGNVTVKNLVFEKFGGGDVSGSEHAALKAVEGWVVENNEFKQISAAGVLLFNGATARNNYIHHNGKYGLNGDGRVEGNVISYNNTDGFDPNNDSGGTKFHGTRGLVVRGNVVSNNVGRGVWTDFDNLNTVIENNLVEFNLEMGIFHEVSCSSAIRYNVARGNNSAMAGKSLWYGAQIYLRSSKDTEIYGNHIIAAGSGVNGVSLRGGDSPLNGPNCGSISLRSVWVHDNLIQLDTGDLHGVVGGGAGYGNSIGVSFTANTYLLQSLNAGYFFWDAAGNPMTKSQWQAAGQDTSGNFSQY